MKHYIFDEKKTFGENDWKFRLFMKFYLNRINFESVDDFLDFYGEGIVSFLENLDNLRDYKDISKLANKVRYSSFKLLGYRAIRDNGKVTYRKFLLPQLEEEQRKL